MTRNLNSILKKYFRFFKYVKYAVPLLVIIITLIMHHSVPLFLSELFELFIIIFISNIIIEKRRIPGIIVNSVLMLLFNLQLLIHLFTVEFLTMVMLENITLIEDLSGKAFIYVPSVLIVVLVSVLPIDTFKRVNKLQSTLLSTTLAAELLLAMFVGNAFSPMFNLIKLGSNYVERQVYLSQIASSENVTNIFYNSGVVDCRAKPENLPESPNVVLIFVEGLSSNIITDSRNIMPNVAYWQSQSVNFTGYYNHTFATYRALMGQLYSGYTYEGRDSNTLVSLPQIFSNLGYNTNFINTEPSNLQFVNYLEELGFDEVISSYDSNGGFNQSVTDDQALNYLFELMEEQSNSSTPFFTSIYTFGTHASFDSTSQMYGDGSNPMLNKFYNLDYWFGEFMERFNNSPMAENTIIIFTADHSTYVDLEYSQTFPDQNRPLTSVDEMPLFIYYAGIEPEEIYVAGRNTVSLAPTILDYLDISEPNYFLGFSLFMSNINNNNFDTVHASGDAIFSTMNDVVAGLTDNQREVVTNSLQLYYTAATQEPVDLYSN